jgi:predicted RNase H-like nuclease (RuvC/YqgF family)
VTKVGPKEAQRRAQRESALIETGSAPTRKMTVKEALERYPAPKEAQRRKLRDKGRNLHWGEPMGAGYTVHGFAKPTKPPRRATQTGEGLKVGDVVNVRWPDGRVDRTIVRSVTPKPRKIDAEAQKKPASEPKGVKGVTEQPNRLGRRPTLTKADHDMVVAAQWQELAVALRWYRAQLAGARKRRIKA